MRRRTIIHQFEFFILSTIISLLLIHIIISREGGGVLLSQTPLDPTGGSSILLLAAISLFGILGASVSSLLSLSKVLTDSQIMEQVGDLRLAFGRIIVGAAGAMVIYIFLLSGAIDIFVLTYSGVLMIAFVAGFSERLLVNAVKSITGESEDTDNPNTKATQLSDQVNLIEETMVTMKKAASLEKYRLTVRRLLVRPGLVVGVFS